MYWSLLLDRRVRAGWRDCTSPQPCGTGRTGALLAAMYFTILDQGKEVARSSTLSLSRRTDRTKNPGTHPPSRGRGLNSIPAAARSSHYPANSGVKARYRLTAGRHFSCRCPAHTGSGSASHTTTTALVFPPRVSKSPPTNNEERMKREEVVLRYPPCRVFREGVRGWLETDGRTTATAPHVAVPLAPTAALFPCSPSLYIAYSSAVRGSEGKEGGGRCGDSRF